MSVSYSLSAYSSASLTSFSFSRANYHVFCEPMLRFYSYSTQYALVEFNKFRSLLLLTQRNKKILCQRTMKIYMSHNRYNV